MTDDLCVNGIEEMLINEDYLERIIKLKRGGNMPEVIKASESQTWTPISIPNDVYQAKVTGIRDKVFDNRDTWIISFEITDQRSNGTIIEGIASCLLTDNTKLWQWCIAMGIEMNTNISISKDDLISKECRIITDTKNRMDKEGKPFKTSFVKGVLPK